MADVGTAREWHPIALAPVPDHRLQRLSERAVVGLDQEPPEPQLADPAEARLLADMEQEAVDPVKLLVDLLDQQFGAAEVGFERGSHQAGQHHQVEGEGRPGKPSFERGGIAAGEPAQAPRRSLFAAVAAGNVLHHRPMRDLDPRPVQRGEQEPAVAIADDALGPGRGGKIARGLGGDAVRTIAAAGKPQGVDPILAEHLPQRGQPLGIGTGEMPFLAKALRVDDQLDAEAPGERRRLFGRVPLQRAAWRNHSDPHPPSAPLPLACRLNRAMPMTSSSTFFCGIGGSGMLPLACIVRARGGRVAGSDRALDAGRLAPKFDFLRAQGIALHPQDGSGLEPGMTLITSAAVEATIPDVVRARELGLPHLTRPELLAELLNAAGSSVAVGGTSGKSTVTGMIGWILHQAGRRPTVMNGAVMKNFVSPETPFASALVGDPDLFVSEVDESDGSIALYRPRVAVLNNVSLDHKEMDELRALFGGFLAAAGTAVVNLDDAESRLLAPESAVGFGFNQPCAVRGTDLQLAPGGARFTVTAGSEQMEVQLTLPGRHNALNALAAIAATGALGVSLGEAAAALAGFAGLKRRLETVGTAAGVTVFDDFAHNPDKIAATLATLTARGGRLLVLFQPHGYGPLAKMGEELAATFAGGLRGDDQLLLSDPVYQGGTVDRSRGSEWLADAVRAHGGRAEHLPERPALAARLLDLARAGDTIAILGARDDTLSEFAAELVGNLRARG